MTKQDGKKRPGDLFQSAITRVIIVIVALVLPINIMTLVFSSMSITENRRQMERDEQNTVDTIGNSVQDNLNRSMKRMLSLCLNDTDFITMAKANRNLTAGEAGALIYHVRSTLERLRRDYSLIEYVYFYFPERDYLIGATSLGIDMNSFRDQIRASTDQPSRMLWQMQAFDDQTILWGRNSWGGMHFGIALNLEHTLRQLKLPQRKTGYFLFSNLDETLHTSGWSSSGERRVSLSEVRASSRHEFYSFQMENKDLVLTEVIEMEGLYAKLPAAIVAMQIISILLCVTVIPYLLSYVHRRIRRPINRLVRAMERVEHGDLSYRIKVGNEGREFDQINRSFNEMMDQIQALKIDNYEKELERRDIKTRYLSRQVLPHFILNALNILYSYEPEEYPLIQKMILCITKYFRYIVKVNATFVSLEQELDHIRNYFEIQRARFPDLFIAVVECDPDVKDALIPPLIVQNFAENAIKHSLTNGREITIHIQAVRVAEEGKDPLLRITLTDTGIGISDEVFAKIERFEQTGEHQEGLGIGIENSIDRLRYLYNQNERRITLRRGDNETGTHVELILPLFFEQDEGGQTA